MKFNLDAIKPKEMRAMRKCRYFGEEVGTKEDGL